MAALFVQVAVAQVCHVPGECQGSLLGVHEFDTYFQCQQICKEVPGCTWFSHLEDFNECIVYSTCDSINAGSCSNCYSGEVSCLVCGYPGVCQDDFLVHVHNATEDDCSRQCQATPDCGFYTFYPDSSSCFLTENCTYADDSTCPSCVIGQAGCAPPITTTPVATTTTATIPTTTTRTTTLSTTTAVTPPNPSKLVLLSKNVNRSSLTLIQLSSSL